MIIEIFIVLLVLAIAGLISARFVYGHIIQDSWFYDVLKRQKDKEARLNMYNPTIIYFHNLPYISSHPMDILCKYHISGVGRIPRWSKMHTLIETAIQEELTKDL